jgi:hypothetical protein
MSKKPQAEQFKRRRQQALAARRREAERKGQAFQRRYVALLPKEPLPTPEEKR